MRRGTGQLQLQRAGIRRAYAHLFPAALAAIVRFSILQRVKHLGILTTELRMQQAFVSIYKILRCDGVTIAPLGIAQVECPFRSIGVVLPPLGHAREDARFILRIRAHQSFQQSRDNLTISHGGSFMRVKAERLLIIADDEDPLLRCLLCRTASIPTASQQHGGYGNADGQQHFHAPYSTTSPRTGKRTMRQFIVRMSFFPGTSA